jgi:peptidyl-prolyl cis-trans isomerase D
MISWIQKYFQRHFKTVFGVMLALMIVSLVGIYNPSSGLGRGEQKTRERYFLKYDLNLPDDQARLFGDGSLSASLKFGSLAGATEDQIGAYAYDRAAHLHLADQWHLPAATDSEIREQIKTLRMFAGQDGTFDQKAYDSFRDRLKTNPKGPTQADVLRVIGDDVRHEKVTALLSGPGFVMPAEVKQQLVRSETTWTLATATVDYASFSPALKPTDADLTKHLEAQAFRYEIPPRLVVSAVEFSSGNYVNAVTVTEADARAYYDANPSRFPKPPEVKPFDAATPATPPKVDPAADFAAVRSLVEAALKFERAKKLAVQAASDFSEALDKAKVTAGPALEKFLADRKLTLRPLAPFARDAGPAELGGAPELATEAWQLSARKFFSDALPTASGGAVLFWKELQPARKPQFADIRDKLATDWTESEKRKAFVELGRTLKAQLETRLKAGEPIDKAAAALATASNVKIDVKTPAAFTPRNPPQDLDRPALGALERLEKGQLADMDITSGLFVYAVDKKAPDLTEANPQFAATRTQLTGFYSRMGSGSYVSELVAAELKKSEPKP